MLPSLLQLRENRALSKATILLASAALESNLTYLSGLALRFIEARPEKFMKPHTDLLRGFGEEIDENGKIVKRQINKTLIERMQIVPQLLARAVDRSYKLPTKSACWKKLRRTIERRDAIVHPRWERYVTSIGWWEAAEAVDAVELYLHSVHKCLQRYVMGYTHMLWTIKGPTKHDMGIGHRTFGKTGPNRKISTMEEIGIARVLTDEWCDSQLMTLIALTQQCEADSDGSMLTRAAIVLMYAMLDAQLSVVSEWKMRERASSFGDAEVHFLNEAAVYVGHDGEVWTDSDQHSFKKRVKAIPAVLARCVEGKEFSVSLGTSWGQELQNGHMLRSKVMHSSTGEQMPRISKDELRTSVRAVRAYFKELAQAIPSVFGHMEVFLKEMPGEVRG